MSVTIGIRFITGQYHATAWDQAVNTGGSEWPPSPWRIARALLSTWHTRCPQLPAEQVDRVLAALATQPPHYWLPPTRPSHTRHYLPGATHRSDEPGGTSLTLDPRRQVDPSTPLLVHWPDLHLDSVSADALDRLVADIPYLGRAESRCEAEVVADMASLVQPTHERAVPVPEGADVKVLTPDPAVTRAQLEVTPDAMRKSKRLTPSGAHWVGYQTVAASSVREATMRPRTRSPHAVRWVLDSSAPFRSRDGILATTGLRGAVLGALGGGKALEGDPRAWLVAGPHDGAAVGDHQHAHWWWVADQSDTIRELLMWVPGGIPVEWVGRVAGVNRLPDFQDPPKGYRPGAALHLQSLGELDAACPRAAAVATRWRTVTPMLTDRFPKRNGDPQLFVRREVERELAYRSLWWPQLPTIRDVRLLRGWEAPQVVSFRRYRWKETMAARRRGFEVEVEFEQPVSGPVSLGALSHFGFGLFEPVG